ncbi:HipA domain-containing protein [Subtercola sp. PAMC28395]|uniref:type II toxin-antitoxin system HipA family toxin n=1 Tax=Subtercola sp. PAMC28395 TaxID=2846775 RepID=UPI001C0BB4C1|nr:HipA domain-containing protein [Subtercola sp. PAMC28395]QWT24084.1 HipA domain-containing protein [Subtercola sp. PAMC28395]
MSEALEVWLRDRRIGSLKPTRRGASFSFDEDIVTSSPGLPTLSTALPVRAPSADAELTRAWFTGLLPEGQQRVEVSRRFGLESGSYFDMLRETGWECAGAVVVVPPQGAPRSASLRALTASDITERLNALPGHPFDANDALRISLGGYQAKMLVTSSAEGWSLPLDGAISTHILKPQPARQWPGIIEGEAWTMTLAASTTPTAEVDLMRLDGAPLTLVVTRFDRIEVGGTLIRIHQEDAAQAMGIHPDRKYASRQASKSDPSLLKIAGLLERYSAAPRTDLHRLLQQVVVNVAVGNTDAHAKNYGIMHRTEVEISLSPMYDVVPAAVVNPATTEMGLRVGGTLLADRVTTTKIIDEARSWGMRENEARHEVEETLVALRAGTEYADERYPDTPPAISAWVSGRIGELLDQLAVGVSRHESV